MSTPLDIPPPVVNPPIVILASQSPNRLRLMRQMRIEATVIVSDFEENLPKSLPVREFVEQTALGKLETIKKLKNDNKEPYDAIVACDTVIYYDGEIIGKPADAQDAVNTLKRLRGQKHAVYSGVAIAYKDGSQVLFSEETFVTFGQFPDSLIENYVATGEPLNKAGSYGIQDYGAIFVEKVDGCFSNIVGLPIHRVYLALVNKGIL